MDKNMNRPSLPSSTATSFAAYPDADEWTTRGRESPSLLLGPRRLPAAAHVPRATR